VGVLNVSLLLSRIEAVAVRHICLVCSQCCTVSNSCS
jgi:hypothetical protein